MSPRLSYTRRIAFALMHLSSRSLPPRQRAWLLDMQAEVEHIPSDVAALKWAAGCLLASIQERMYSMKDADSSSGISQWVLLIEWIGCFGSLTLMWLYTVWYIATQSHVPPDVIIVAVIATMGPAALAVAVTATFSASYARRERIFRVLSIGFGAMAVLQLLNAGAHGRLRLQWFEFDASVIVLCGLLPLLASLHLIHLGRHSDAPVVQPT